MQSNTSNPKHNMLRMWPEGPTLTNNHLSHGGEGKGNDVVVDRIGGKIRVGSEYQAIIPNLIPENERNVEAECEKALALWRPNFAISDAQYDKYMAAAEVEYQYSWEQSLGILYWHQYEFSLALEDIKKFCPKNEEWTSRDMAKFERAYNRHGKAFDRIQRMLPNKSMSSLMIYYYGRNKNRKRNVMKGQAKTSLEQRVKDLSMK